MDGGIVARRAPPPLASVRPAPDRDRPRRARSPIA
jgi:hypothetical protein